ncbi:unnamed protein product [Plutella xylostella]|uniref:(diamondback moth) hypothetical protein n=1 Tax=Plutella xylostella TaxID=51655 RepID=A0A8S4G6C6_PLUXY|nr:unnamed protein product [Plutella xylostella]
MDQPGGGDAVRNPSRRVSRRSEKWAVETRIATMNICGGLDGKIDEVCEVFNTRGMDLLCVNESKRKGRGITTHGTLTAYWSRVPESEHGCQGVGIVLSERWNNCVKEYECVSPRLIWIRLKVGLTRLFVLGVYAPDTSKSAQEIDEFWKSMNVVLDDCDENERVIMLGDFNSWVGVQRDGYESVLGAIFDQNTEEIQNVFKYAMTQHNQNISSRGRLELQAYVDVINTADAFKLSRLSGVRGALSQGCSSSAPQQQLVLGVAAPRRSPTAARLVPPLSFRHKH